MDGSFPWENMKQLASLGVLGMSVPEEYGGLGLPILDTALILEEIAKVCYVTAMAVLGEAGVQTRVIARYAPAVDPRPHPPPRGRRRLHAGDLHDRAARRHRCRQLPHQRAHRRRPSHPEGHQDTDQPRARGRHVHRVQPHRRQAGPRGHRLHSAGSRDAGFEVTGTYHTMGGENLFEIQFNDCELPLENLVIKDDGFRKLLTAFNTQRCLNPAISLGLAEGAFDEAVNYVRERTVFGKPIADHQGIRWKLADMFKDIEAGRGILYRACLTADPFPDPFMAAAAKVFCNEMSLRVTSEAVQLHGGFGFTDEAPVSRLYRGARYGTIGGGTSETLRDLMGRKIVSDVDFDQGILALGTY